MTVPNCPQCASEYTYQDGNLIVCPMCAFEFTLAEQAAKEAAKQEATIVRDAHGQALKDGDLARVIQDLRVSKNVTIKRGARVTKLRILDEEMDGHNIDCHVEGVGDMYLKSAFIQKQ